MRFNYYRQGPEGLENEQLANELEQHLESAKLEAEKGLEEIFTEKDCLTEETKGLDQCLEQPLEYEPIQEMYCETPKDG